MTLAEADLTDIKDLTAGLERFIDSAILPLEEENAELLADKRGAFYTESGAYSPAVVELMRETRMRSAQAGYYAMFCPTDMGGGGLGATAQLLTYEFIFRHYGQALMLPRETIGHWAYGPSALCREFSEGLQARLLDDIVAGRVGMCFGMSEPDAGSDAWMMRTRAVRHGDEWVIDGTKQWTTNGPHADYCYLFAVTDPDLARDRKGGISCFVVPMKSPGVKVNSVIKIFGEVGGNEAILSFTDVRVPTDHLVGQEGQGFKLAMGGVSRGRVYNCGRTLGLSQWALRLATEYAKTRVTFGKPIAEHQGVSFKLAESAMDIYAAHHASLDLTARLDRGEVPIRELAMAKALASETLLRVTDRAIQVCGGMGITNEMHLYSLLHTARVGILADGSAEILRQTIAKRLLKGDLDF